MNSPPGEAGPLKELAQRYTYTLRWDSDGQLFRGLCHEFHGLEVAADSPLAALDALVEAVMNRVDHLAADGRQLPELSSPTNRLGIRQIREALRVASQLQDRSSDPADALLGLISHQCSEFVSRGGTADELAAVLGYRWTA